LIIKEINGYLWINGKPLQGKPFTSFGDLNDDG